VGMSRNHLPALKCNRPTATDQNTTNTNRCLNRTVSSSSSSLIQLHTGELPITATMSTTVNTIPRKLDGTRFLIISAVGIPAIPIANLPSTRKT
jgi:hypothetical protein